MCRAVQEISSRFWRGRGDRVGRRRGRSLEPLGWFVEVWEGLRCRRRASSMIVLIR